ncbi:MAG: hypothetical protein GY947_13965 [Rhodobacteraceae bacterium]|nr:hypothetical protein [Paracoccaceae bacterium]
MVDVLANVDSIAVVIAAVAVAVAAYQVYLSRKQLSEELRWREEEFDWRKKDRVSKFSVFQNPEYREARDRIRGEFGEFSKQALPLELDRVLTAFEKDDALRMDVQKVISHWGRLSMDLNNGLLDETFAYKMHHKNLCYVYMAFVDYIDYRSSPNNLSFPGFYELGKKWAKKSEMDNKITGRRSVVP